MKRKRRIVTELPKARAGLVYDNVTINAYVCYGCGERKAPAGPDYHVLCTECKAKRARGVTIGNPPADPPEPGVSHRGYTQVDRDQYHRFLNHNAGRLRARREDYVYYDSTRELTYPYVARMGADGYWIKTDYLHRYLGTNIG